MSFTQSKKDFGRIGEDLALQHLKSQGYRTLARNFRSRFGEIDIVALKGDTLVFVEVKTRWSKKFGDPKEAVSALKMRRIKKAAEYYALTHPTLPQKLLIQLVAIDLERQNHPRLEVISVF